MSNQSLGSLLLQHGWITKEQLGLAISKQKQIGGRLGSCLLEMGAVSESLLDRTLAEQQSVPLATAEDLSDVPAEVIQLLPARIAIRYQAVPFSSTSASVDIAMLEVDNLWLQDELSFIIGRGIRVHASNEVRLVAALARYYHAPLPERFAKLERLLEQQRQRPSEATSGIHPESRLVHAGDFDPSPPPVVPIERPTQRPHEESTEVTAEAGATGDVAPQSIPLSEKELTALDAEPATDPTEGTVSPFLYARDHTPDGTVEIDDLEGRLAAATEADEIGQILVEYLAQLFVRVSLFKVRQGFVVGWMGHGPGLDEARFAGFNVPVDEPSIFLNLREGGSFFVGKLPEMEAHLELAACWRKDLSDECAVFPLRIQDHLVSLIYGDRGPLGLRALDLELMRRLVTLASQSFERCIRQQKKQELRQAPDR